MSPSTSGVTSRPWTPRCTPPPPQQQQPSVPSHPHPHPPPDYHHNVYIPGTPSGFCTLRPAAQRSELDVHNSFSTFGKKRRLQMSPQGEAAIINNDLYNDWPCGLICWSSTYSQGNCLGYLWVDMEGWKESWSNKRKKSWVISLCF